MKKPLDELLVRPKRPADKSGEPRERRTTCRMPAASSGSCFASTDTGSLYLIGVDGCTSCLPSLSRLLGLPDRPWWRRANGLLGTVQRYGGGGAATVKFRELA